VCILSVPVAHELNLFATCTSHPLRRYSKYLDEEKNKDRALNTDAFGEAVFDFEQQIGLLMEVRASGGLFPLCSRTVSLGAYTSRTVVYARRTSSVCSLAEDACWGSTARLRENTRRVPSLCAPVR